MSMGYPKLLPSAVLPVRPQVPLVAETPFAYSATRPVGAFECLRGLKLEAARGG